MKRFGPSFIVLSVLAVAAYAGPQATQDVAEVATPATPPWSVLASKVIDLTYSFDDDTIYRPTATEGFVLDVVSEGMTEKGYYYSAYKFRTPEHGGTHLDAPVHFGEGKWTTEQIPVERLIGPGVVVDVTAKAAEDPDYLVSAADSAASEAKYGRIPNGAIVLLRTGWGAYWPYPQRYLGTDKRAPRRSPSCTFPASALMLPVGWSRTARSGPSASIPLASTGASLPGSRATARCSPRTCQP